MAKANKKAEKPLIYKYHDYRVFLKDWLDYRVEKAEKFSIRRLAKLAGLSSGYLPMVINGNRNLTEKSLHKLESFLGLNESEFSYLKLLRILADSNSQPERLEALKKMQKFSNYCSQNNEEVKAYKFLTKWYHIVIREMVDLKNFRPHVDWIKKTLLPRVSKKEIREALNFLTQNEFLTVKENEMLQNEKHLNCVGSVYKIGLTQFHKDMFELATQSIDTVPSHLRSIVGHTLSISQDQFDEVKVILDEALEKISKIENKKAHNEVVYHTSLVAFPITEKDNGVK